MALSWKAVTENVGIAASGQGFYFWLIDSETYATLYRLDIDTENGNTGIVELFQTQGEDPVTSARQMANLIEGN